MLSKVWALMGTLVALVLVISALWAWGSAARMAAGADNPALAAWAIRCAAIAALAAAQVLGLTFVVDLFYARDRVGEVMRLSAGFVCTAALVCAIALGFASK